MENLGKSQNRINKDPRKKTEIKYAGKSEDDDIADLSMPNINRKFKQNS